jgi:SNF2 family DNA or RNA helicase
MNKARFKILQLLMKLRQICIDPNILFSNYDGEVIKMEKLLEVVNNFVKDGHKILIFSSFKTVVDRVKSMFDSNNISSYMIAGDVKSKTRMDLVEKFNNDSTNCFLITLKSGGTGLNLVGADVVIHLDIWWNPQVENQATDRAHRIGQTKKVTVIKFVTRGTIEERIIELQNKKKILSDNLIEGKDNSDILSSLNEDNIRDLLSYSE